MNSPDTSNPAPDLASWVPWSLELNEIIDTVRSIGSSHAAEPVRRAQLAGLAERTRRLLDQIGYQPALPGLFGRALDVLRAPIKAEPVHIAEALARLGCLAALVQPVATPARVRLPRLKRGTKPWIDQEPLPGFQPSTTTEEGVTP